MVVSPFDKKWYNKSSTYIAQGGAKAIFGKYFPPYQKEGNMDGFTGIPYNYSCH